MVTTVEDRRQVDDENIRDWRYNGVTLEYSMEYIEL